MNVGIITASDKGYRRDYGSPGLYRQKESNPAG